MSISKTKKLFISKMPITFVQIIIINSTCIYIVRKLSQMCFIVHECIYKTCRILRVIKRNFMKWSYEFIFFAKERDICVVFKIEIKLCKTETFSNTLLFALVYLLQILFYLPMWQDAVRVLRVMSLVPLSNQEYHLCQYR